MHNVVATDDLVAWFFSLSLCWSVTLFVTRLNCAKTAERIDVLFGVDTLKDTRRIVLDGGLICATTRGGGRFCTL